MLARLASFFQRSTNIGDNIKQIVGIIHEINPKDYFFDSADEQDVFVDALEEQAIEIEEKITPQSLLGSLEGLFQTFALNEKGLQDVQNQGAKELAHAILHIKQNNEGFFDNLAGLKLESGFTLMHLASYLGEPKLLKAVLQETTEYELYTRDYTSYSAIQLIEMHTDQSVLPIALSMGAKLNQKIFVAACASNNIEAVKMILKRKEFIDLGGMGHDLIFKLIAGMNNTQLFTQLLKRYENDWQYLGRNLTADQMLNIIQFKECQRDERIVLDLLDYILKHKMEQTPQFTATLLQLSEEGILNDDHTLLSFLIRYDLYYPRSQMPFNDIMQHFINKLSDNKEESLEHIELLLRHSYWRSQIYAGDSEAGIPAQNVQNLISRIAASDIGKLGGDILTVLQLLPNSQDKSYLNSNEFHNLMQKMIQSGKGDSLAPLLNPSSHALEKFNILELYQSDALTLLIYKLQSLSALEPQQQLDLQKIFNEAVAKGQIKLCSQILAQYGQYIDLYVLNEHKLTPLMSACLLPTSEMVDLLLASNFDFLKEQKASSACMIEGRFITHAQLAYLSGNRELALKFITDGKVNNSNILALSVLKQAIGQKDTDCVKVIFRYDDTILEKDHICAESLSLLLSDTKHSNTLELFELLLLHVPDKAKDEITQLLVDHLLSLPKPMPAIDITLLQSAFAQHSINPNLALPASADQVQHISLLLQLIRDKHFDLVESLLLNPDLDVNFGTTNQNTVSCVLSLLEQDAKPDAATVSTLRQLLIHKNSDLITDDKVQLLHRAAEYIRPEDLHEIAKNHDISTKDELGHDLLMASLMTGNADLAIELITNHGFRANNINIAKQTPLMVAAPALKNLDESQKAEFIQMLVNNSKYKVDVADQYGIRAIEYLIRAGDTQSVNILIEPPFKCALTQSSILAAYASNDDDMISFIERTASHQIKAGILSAKNEYQQNILHILSSDPIHLGRLDVMLEQAIDAKVINAQDKGGVTPLMIAVHSNNITAMKLLLSQPNLDINAKDKDGNSALMIACQNSNPSIVKMLTEDHRININLQNHGGVNALMIVAYNLDLNTKLSMSEDALKKAEQVTVESEKEQSQAILMKLLQCGADPLSLRQERSFTTKMTMALLKTSAYVAVSNLVIRYVPMLTIWVTYARTMMVAHEIRDFVTNMTTDAIKEHFTIPHINIGQMCFAGAVHIDWLGRVSQGETLKNGISKAIGVQFQNANFTADSLSQMPELQYVTANQAKNEKNAPAQILAHKTLLMQYMQLQRLIEKSYLPWTKKSLKALSDELLMADKQIVENLHRTNAVAILGGDSLYPEYIAYIKATDPTYVASALMNITDPQKRRNAIEILTNIANNQVIAHIDLVYKAKIVLLEYHKAQAKDVKSTVKLNSGIINELDNMTLEQQRTVANKEQSDDYTAIELSNLSWQQRITQGAAKFLNKDPQEVVSCVSSNIGQGMGYLASVGYISRQYPNGAVTGFLGAYYASGVVLSAAFSLITGPVALFGAIVGAAGLAAWTYHKSEEIIAIKSETELEKLQNIEKQISLMKKEAGIDINNLSRPIASVELLTEVDREYIEVALSETEANNISTRDAAVDALKGKFSDKVMSARQSIQNPESSHKAK